MTISSYRIRKKLEPVLPGLSAGAQPPLILHTPSRSNRPRSPSFSRGPLPLRTPAQAAMPTRTCAPLEDPRVQGRTQDPANEWDPRQVLNVLQGDALAAAPGQN